MPKKKKASFGGCQLANISPYSRGLAKVLNLSLSFEEGLKLHLALHECLSHLNSYNRATRGGKSAAIVLAVKPHMERIDVVEGKI